MSDTGRALVVWWSTNTRCASVLGRSAVASGIPTLVVLDPQAPRPGKDLLAGATVVDRPHAPLTASELHDLVAVCRTALGCDEAVLAPTSEYLLDALHGAMANQVPPGLVVPCTARMPYRELSSKAWGSQRFRGGDVISSPREIVGEPAQIPFVAKPRFNHRDGAALKPFVVCDEAGAHEYRQLGRQWFAQEFVPAPSYYWCAYRGADGLVTDYFQHNLLQRPGGDSIVLAVAEPPPDADGIRQVLVRLLEDVGFVGPAMVELRGHPARFIEINPRFWGPLLLDILTGGRIVDAFLRDHFGVPYHPWLDRATLSRTRAYVVPSALSEHLVSLSPKDMDDAEPPDADALAVAVDGPRLDRPVLLDAGARVVLLDLAGFDPAPLGGAW